MQNCSIRIEGLSEKTTTEALRNYFENTKRSHGGDVEDATIVGETAFVLFADHEGKLPSFDLVTEKLYPAGYFVHKCFWLFDEKKYIVQVL